MTRLLAEDRPFLVGTARFTADLDASDAWHVRFVRSALAHAVLIGIERPPLAGATPPRVVLVNGDLGVAPYAAFPQLGVARPLLADGRVRFAGEAVALVAAPSAAEAEDLAEQVVVDLEPLPAVVDLDAADADTVVVHGHLATNTVFPVVQEPAADPFAGAAFVLERRSVNPRLSPLPLETSAVVVRPRADGGLDVWAACQGVHAVRADVAEALGLDPSVIRVRAPSVGGGFGARYRPPIEYLAVAAAARRLGRPLRWVEDRTEQLLAQAHGRAQRLDVALGVAADGRFTGLRVRGLADAGAYPSQAPLLVEYTRKMAPGPYRIGVVDFAVHSVVTTTAPVGAYRGAGQPEIATAVEQLVDDAARRLGVDPIELRRRNVLRPEELPYCSATGVTYDGGDLPAALDQVAAALTAWRADSVAAPPLDGHRHGFGVSCYAQITAVGQLSMRGQLAVAADGTITAGAGSHAHGQGHRSTFARLVADRLGVEPEAIGWVDADTDAVTSGIGTGGSRSAALTGHALSRAAERLLERARRLAADHLEADPSDIVAGDGGLAVAGVPASRLSWAALARLANGAGGPLQETYDADPAPPNTPYGAHASMVDVDLETGAVRIVRHLAVDDCGVRLSPDLVEGQQHGGVVAGLSQALGEEIVYDPDGTPRTTTLADYFVPAASELPAIATGEVQVAAATNELGVRGIGENGAIAATPAVLNAVADALDGRPVDLPLRAERVWQAARGPRPAGAP